MTDTRLPSKQHQQFCVAELEKLVGADNVNDTLQLFLEGVNELIRHLDANDEIDPESVMRGAHQMRSSAKLLGIDELESKAKEILGARTTIASDEALLTQASITPFHEALKLIARDVKRYLAENKQAK